MATAAHATVRECHMSGAGLPTARLSTVRVERWSYVCGGCGSSYDLPGADLSFSYGTFLGRSVAGEVATFDSFGESVWAEVEDLIRVDSRTRFLDLGEVGQLTQGALSFVCDPAPSGNPYVIDETPGCPTCGSTKIDSFIQHPDEPLAIDVPAMTHRVWDRLSSQDKSSAVGGALTRLLGEA